MSTARERVLCSLNHQTPDRIPLDLSGHRSSGIHAIAYRNLRSFLGLPPKPLRVYDPIQQLAIVDDDVLEYFGVDTLELGRAFATEDKHWREWALPDGTACYMPSWALPEKHDGEWVLRNSAGRILGRMPQGALFFEQIYYPFAEADPVECISDAFKEAMWFVFGSPPGPLGSGPEGLQVLAEGAKKLRAQTQRCIIGLFGGNLLETGQMLYRNDGFLMLLASDPDRAHQFLDKLVSIHLANLERFLGAVGPYIDVILFGDDLGMQKGPQISPAMYREFFKPRHQMLWQRAKQLAPVKVMLHCCGGVQPLLNDLIEAGLDTINPVQTSCKGMDAAQLKTEFGSRLTFWGGGCDTQSVLNRGTPTEVREHVNRQIQLLSPNGGFIFQQVHNIMADVPPQNIVAMYDAVKQFQG